MRNRLSGSQLVIVTVAICTAFVLAPTAVIAASGITIFNASNTRSVRVGADGSLHVENRAGVSQNTVNLRGSRLGTGYVNLLQVVSPRQIAVTDMTVTALGPTDEPQTILVEANVRISGTGTCTNPGAGFSTVVLRRLAVHNGSTLALNFNGPPLVARSSVSGRLICFGYRAVAVPVGSESDVGITVYPFVT